MSTIVLPLCVQVCCHVGVYVCMVRHALSCVHVYGKTSVLYISLKLLPCVSVVMHGK